MVPKYHHNCPFKRITEGNSGLSSTCQYRRWGSLGQEEPLEKEMATHSSILAWEIPWREEPGGLPSMGWQSWTWLSNYTAQQGEFCCAHGRRESAMITEEGVRVAWPRTTASQEMPAATRRWKGQGMCCSLKFWRQPRPCWPWILAFGSLTSRTWKNKSLLF